MTRITAIAVKVMERFVWIWVNVFLIGCAVTAALGVVGAINGQRPSLALFGLFLLLGALVYRWKYHPYRQVPTFVSVGFALGSLASLVAGVLLYRHAL